MLLLVLGAAGPADARDGGVNYFAFRFGAYHASSGAYQGFDLTTPVLGVGVGRYFSRNFVLEGDLQFLNTDEVGSSSLRTWSFMVTPRLAIPWEPWEFHLGVGLGYHATSFTARNLPDDIPVRSGSTGEWGVHGLVGVSFDFSAGWSLGVEGRYLHANGEMTGYDREGVVVAAFFRFWF